LSEAARSMDIAREWKRIDKMAGCGMKLSSRRLREFAGACRAQGASGIYIDGLISCVAGILREEEKSSGPAEQGLEELLGLLEQEKA
jgi:hypothetical protein